MAVSGYDNREMACYEKPPLTTIVKRYYEQDTWKENLIFEKDSFELLQDILESAGELSDRADCENLVTTAFAEAAIS